MLKVVIVGYGEMFTNLIAGTLDANCKIVGVFRKSMIKDKPIVRIIKDTFNPSVEYNYIKSYNLKEINAPSINSEEFKKQMFKLNPDIMLVGSWGEKIKKEIFDIPKIASINAHPSLLPKYRGPNPYFWTIKNQEQKSGVTFHLIDDKFDRGAILAQEEVKIFPSDTGESLKARTVLAARGVVCELLKALSEDVIIPLQQREDRASYFSSPMFTELDFRNSAEENYALARACHPWCDCYFYHNDTCLVAEAKNMEISENTTSYNEAGRIVDIDLKNRAISVLCGNNKILKIRKIYLDNYYDRIFSYNYIKQDMRIGMII